jgi:hypothetical protein
MMVAGALSAQARLLGAMARVAAIGACGCYVCLARPRVDLSHGPV